MTLDHIRLVQTSFEAVRPVALKTSQLFYARLFETKPALRYLFSEDMAVQQAKLMDMLGMIVRRLDQAEAYMGEVKALGQRHVTYRVEDAHYADVGTALLWALQQVLGAAFTPEVGVAWHEAYFLVAGLMKEAAEA